MKNDTTTTALNIVLAALVILSVVFALFSIWRMRDLRSLQPQVQLQMQQAQVVNMRAKQLLDEVVTYNNTAKNPELNQIILSVQPPQPAK